jgi:hypothetical protein
MAHAGSNPVIPIWKSKTSVRAVLRQRQMTSAGVAIKPTDIDLGTDWAQEMVRG